MGLSIFDQIDKPGAITSLLQAMGPQVTPSAAQPTPGVINNINPPQAAQLPPPSQQFNVAPEQSRPRMLSRVVHGLMSLPGAIANAAQTPMPPEVQAAVQAGLLSPQEAAAARPGFLSSLAGTAAQNPGGPQGAYRDAVNGILGVHQMAQQVAEQRRIDAVRSRMATMFEPKPNETLEQERDRIEKMYSYAVQHGDLATAKQLEGAATESLKRPTASSMAKVIGPGATLVDPNGQVLYQSPMKDPSAREQIVTGQEGTFVLKPDGIYNVATGQKFTGSGVHPVAMAPSYTPVTLGGATPNDPGVVAPFNSKSGTVGRPIGTAKPAGAGGGATGLGTAGIGGVARQAGAIVGLNNANARMVPFEQAVANHTADYTGLDYWQGLRAKMYQADGIKDEAIHAAAYAKLNKDNPELANYLLSAEQWALEDSQLSNRPSDFRTKLDGFVSAIGPNASAKNIGHIQSFRFTRLNELEIARKAMEKIMQRISGDTTGTPASAAPSTVLPGAAPTAGPTAGPKTIIVNGKKFVVP